MAGVVLNRTSAESDPSVPHNAAEIERLTGAKVLASLPFLRDIGARQQALRAALRGKVQFS